MSAAIQPATMKGPAIFLAQLVGAAPPFNSFDAMCGWAAATKAFRFRRTDPTGPSTISPAGQPTTP